MTGNTTGNTTGAVTGITTGNANRRSSRRLRLVNLVLRLAVKPRLARMTDPAIARLDFERAARFVLRAPPGLRALKTVLRADAGRIPALRISAGPVEPGRVILHLHGGAFVAGSPNSHRKMLGRLSSLSGIEVVAPDYRLAPEHPFPAALDDALAAWDALLATGYRPQDIALGGDSAGGGLTFALLARLCARGQRPAMVFAFSPWADLGGTGASVTANARADPLLPAARLHDVAEMYLQGHPATDPEASPILADYPGAPPVLLHHAETEILRDDTLTLAERLRQFGATVTVQAWPDAPHVWHLLDGWLPEARDALTRCAAAIRAGFSLAPRPPDGS